MFETPSEKLVTRRSVNTSCQKALLLNNDKIDDQAIDLPIEKATQILILKKSIWN